MADVSGKFYRATKVRTGVAPSSAGSLEGETLPPINPPGSSLNSVGLTMPSAFTVSNSPLTANGVIGVAGAGTVGQYIRGDGSLADFPQTSGGGSSVSYYLNGSVDQGTIGGVAYKELSKVPILGAGTDFTINADGYIASFITDAGDPNLLEIPGGNWNFETYFSASSGGGSPTFYVELYKVSGTTATLIASSSGTPELIAFGTNLTPYFSTLAVPTTTLALTDRLAVRYYVTHSGRTITLHTENNHLCQIITTFTTGLTALNGLTAQVQNFAVGTTGTDFNIASAVATHTFNLPTASATNRGALSSADWSTFNAKQNALTLTTSGTSGAATLIGATLNIPQYQAALTNPVTGTGSAGQVAYWSSGSAITGESELFWDATNNRLGIGITPTATLQVRGPNALGAFFNAQNEGAAGALFERIGNSFPFNQYTFSNGNVLVGGSVTATSIIRSGGTSSQFLKADGSVDSTSYVSSVTASTPLASSGGTTPNITIQQASGSQSGFLSSTDWTTFNSKTSSQWITSGSNIYYNSGNVLIGTTSDNGARLQVSGTATFTLNQNAGTVVSITNNDNTNSSSRAIYRLSSGTVTSAFLSISTLGAFIGSETNHDLYLFTNGNTRLTIAASTGAATFSSSVTSFSSSPLLASVSTNGANDAIVAARWQGGVGMEMRYFPDFALGYIQNTYPVTSGQPYGDIYFRQNVAGTMTTRMAIKADGGTVSINTLSGSGNRIVVANAGGTLISAVIGSGLAFDGTTLTATGGGSGSISGSGISGFIPVFTGATSIGNSILSLSSNTLDQNRTSEGTFYRLLVNGNGRMTLGTDGSANAIIRTGNNVDLRLGVNEDAITIKNGGNVGIMTQNPTARLTITPPAVTTLSTIEFTNTDNAAITSHFSLVFAVDNTNTVGGRTIAFCKGAKGYGNQVSTMMTILADSGNVLIGTVSDNGYRTRIAGSTNILDLRSTTTNARINVGHSTNGGFIGYINQGAGAQSNVFYVTTGAGTVGIGITMDNNGNFTASGSVTATSFFESSDATLKTLIADNYQAKGIDSVVAKLYIKNGKEELGYFAQDLQNVLPSAVSKGSDGLLNLSYREVHTAKIAYLEEEIRQLKKRYEIN